MYSREYCYIRRAIVCQKENLIVLISKSCDHCKCKEQSNRSAVRVTDYESQMVIRPHSTFDENGFDYLLTYFDDPRAYLPVTAYNWIASSGLPGFVESLHKAAIDLNANQSKERVNSIDVSKENNSKIKNISIKDADNKENQSNRDSQSDEIRNSQIVNTSNVNANANNSNNGKESTKKSTSNYSIKTNSKSNSPKRDNGYADVAFN